MVSTMAAVTAVWGLVMSVSGVSLAFHQSGSSSSPQAFVIGSGSAALCRRRHRRCSGSGGHSCPSGQSFLAPSFSALSFRVSSSSSSSRLHTSFVEDFMASTSKASRKSQTDKYLQSLEARVQRINEWESRIEELSDDEMRQKTTEFRQRLADGQDIDGPLLEEAFALVREAAWRVLELRHYDVQLLGGLVLHNGRLAEMATGEGKTLVATLPAYVNALLPGQSSFVVTVNDYLARRDAEKMGQVHRFLGLSVGLIQSDMTEEQRREAYQSDVIYVTNAELGFDYLRDHLALSPAQTVLPQQQQPGSPTGSLNGFCIVDEADSVLIDEARTPLIIAKQVPSPSNKFQLANRLANDLQVDRHYTVDLKNKNIKLTEQGYTASEKALGLTSIFQLTPDGTGAWAPYIINALKAKELFQKDIEYAVLTSDDDNDSGEANGIGIIDSFTGRVLDGRRWSDGLHQSLEAKEGIAVSSQSQVTAKITYQALFRLFSRLSGMTGTALADADEFESTYDLRVTPIPTALPVARRDYPDVAFKTRRAANEALVKEIVAVGGGGPGGRPCLVGTTSIVQSTQLVEALAEQGITAALLNALPENAARESEIIAQAGRAGVVTVATNMAGRGTDILLGGCPATMARIKVRSELSAVCLSDKEAAALPRAPPSEYFPAPLSDDLQRQLQSAAAAVQQAVEGPMTALQLDELLTLAVDTTESDDEASHIRQLRAVVEAIRNVYQPVLADEKQVVKARGGLYVMGTNRHESSRIDQQLRGRAGRQGDPGSSRFFLSFEDDMFVIFGGSGLEKILNAFRVADDMPVESAQVTEALDRVQETVELKFREIRAQILQFDDVLNAQRQVIFQRRQKMLFANPQETLQLMAQYNQETVRDIVTGQVITKTTSGSSGDKKGTVNVDKLLEKVEQFFPPVRAVIRKQDIEGLDVNAVISFVSIAVEEVFRKKTEEVEAAAKAAGQGANALARSANYLTLVSMDNAWSNHLQNMENLKESINLRTFTNTNMDPSAEYAKEALQLFQGLEDSMRVNSIYSLWQSLTNTGTSAGKA